MLTEVNNGSGSGGNSLGPVPHQMIYRCETDGCKSPVMAKHITEGGCPKCGGRRVRIAVCVTDEEAEWLAAEGYVFSDSGWSNEAVLKKR